MYDYITPFLRMKNISHASDYIELAFLTIRVDDLRIVLGELFALYVEYVFSIRPFCFTKIENRDLNVDDRGEPLWKANIIKYPPVIGTSAINSP
jgi:hypothetical protein